MPNLRIFVSTSKFAIRQVRGALITKRTIVFQNCSPKHPNKTFLVPNLRILIFARNFAIRQIGGR